MEKHQLSFEVWHFSASFSPAQSWVRGRGSWGLDRCGIISRLLANPPFHFINLRRVLCLSGTYGITQSKPIIWQMRTLRPRSESDLSKSIKQISVQDRHLGFRSPGSHLSTEISLLPTSWPTISHSTHRKKEIPTWFLHFDSRSSLGPDSRIFS